MSIALIKLLVVALLALACIIALIADGDATWAQVALSALIGYVVGNARVVPGANPIVERRP